MKKDNISHSCSDLQIFSLTLLRILIGWHFLYEGLTKLFSNPAWTAKSYLMGSVGPFASVFNSIASHSDLLNIIDYLNIWGLIIIGLSLFTGLFSQLFKFLGIALLLLYYIAYPPFPALAINMPVEGNYWIVNKNLIEIAALFVLILFPTSHITGLDRYFRKRIPVGANETKPDSKF